MQTDWEPNPTTQARMTELKDNPFICLRSGFGSLIDALLSKKLFDVKTNAKVISLDPFVYEIADETVEAEFDHVVFACDA